MAMSITKIYCPINSCFLAVAVSPPSLVTVPDYAGEEKGGSLTQASPAYSFRGHVQCLCLQELP